MKRPTKELDQQNAIPILLSTPETALLPVHVRTDQVGVIRCERTKELSGRVRISGSKNVGLKTIALAPLFKEKFSLVGVPRNNQVKFFLDILKSGGADIEILNDGDDGFNLAIDSSHYSKASFSDEEILRCRHTLLLAIATLLRQGTVDVALTGYSHYGPRPIDGQINTLRKFGAMVTTPEAGRIKIELPTKGLVGTDVFLSFPSNAQTEAVLWVGACSKGVTRLFGAAREPETLELIKFLRTSGVNILLSDVGVITIEGVGVDHLVPPRNFVICPDRIEVGTFVATVSLVSGEILLQGVNPEVLGSFFAIGSAMGVEMTMVGDNSLQISKSGRPTATSIDAFPYPGFPTDSLGPFVAALSVANGKSIVQEKIWPNRLALGMELKRMGANIDYLSGQIIAINGVERLSGALVCGTDPRATAALMNAGLFADGVSLVTGTDLLDNAYDGYDQKLQGLGAKLQRIWVPGERVTREHPRYGRLEAF
jgi:UDP-N-acetylglucosamine 1-carboxyvinyltransferase